MTHTTADWEKEFDKEWEAAQDWGNHQFGSLEELGDYDNAVTEFVADPEGIKSFIRKEIAAARAEERGKVVAEVREIILKLPAMQNADAFMRTLKLMSSVDLPDLPSNPTKE